MDQPNVATQHCEPWNKGKLVGQKRSAAPQREIHPNKNGENRGVSSFTSSLGVTPATA